MQSVPFSPPFFYFILSLTFTILHTHISPSLFTHSHTPLRPSFFHVCRPLLIPCSHVFLTLGVPHHNTALFDNQTLHPFWLKWKALTKTLSTFIIYIHYVFFFYIYFCECEWVNPSIFLFSTSSNFLFFFPLYFLPCSFTLSAHSLYKFHSTEGVWVGRKLFLEKGGRKSQEKATLND